jgi:hypothetical protein
MSDLSTSAVAGIWGERLGTFLEEELIELTAESLFVHPSRAKHKDVRNAFLRMVIKNSRQDWELMEGIYP